ncbi:Repulsive guidance molecule A [Trichinella murrelli]|uniref:Repulsive guidance molecule A n=1 Tax=Trichinella murrelli TaxID=144512 RepID=A0A0V0TDB7_9BILA|nr:Repulsive guidance molecule A [Trichinella murrelli]
MKTSRPEIGVKRIKPRSDHCSPVNFHTCIVRTAVESRSAVSHSSLFTIRILSLSLTLSLSLSLSLCLTAKYPFKLHVENKPEILAEKIQFASKSMCCSLCRLDNAGRKWPMGKVNYRPIENSPSSRGWLSFSLPVNVCLRLNGSSSFSLLLITVLLFYLLFSCSSTTTVQATPECGVSRCAQEFTRSLNSHKVLVSSNLPYCLLLEQYEKCLRSTGRSCRGNLLFHSINSMISNHLSSYDCSALVQRYRQQLNGGAVPQSGPYPGADQSIGPVSSGRCLFPYHHQRGASGYRYCTVFGDPHIRTLGGQHETCLTLGAWPLVDDSYFAVQVTNEPLGRGVGASCIGKITVIIKSLTGCTEQKMYEATREFLPSAFVDGTTHSEELPSGTAGESRSSGKWPTQRPAVVIRELVANEHVEIFIRYISTRLTVRLAGGYLLFSVKVPEEIVAQRSSASALQLCLTGCPAGERLDYKEMLADPERLLPALGVTGPAMQRHSAERLCKEAGAADFFFDACVFDLLVTGDKQYRHSAALALRDIRQLYPAYSRNYETNRTDLRLYEMLAKIERRKAFLTTGGVDAEPAPSNGAEGVGPEALFATLLPPLLLSLLFAVPHC